MRKKIYSRILLTISIFVLVLGACASQKMTESQSPIVVEREAAQSEGVVAYDEESKSGFADSSFGDNAPMQEPERLVIKNTNMTLVVDNPLDSMDNISDLAEEMGGFVVSAQMYQSQTDSGIEIPSARLTVRIPAEKLDEALSQIKAESDQPPVNINIESQDVTREYTDLESRLRNLEDAESQLREIMDEAYKTEDVLSVYSRLVEVREQIEVIKGQMQYFQQSAALSAVSVELLVNEAIQPITIGGWQPVGVAKDAVQALINTMQFLIDAVIWILIFIVPVALVIILPFYLVIRLVRRWIKKRKQAKNSKASDST